MSVYKTLYISCPSYATKNIKKYLKKNNNKCIVEKRVKRGFSKVVLFHLYSSFYTLTSGNKLTDKLRNYSDQYTFKVSTNQQAGFYKADMIGWR